MLNADDINCLKMADLRDVSSIFYVTINPGHSLVKEHIKAGGKAIVLESGMNGDMLTIYDNGLHMPVLWSHLIPATLEGKARYIMFRTRCLQPRWRIVSAWIWTTSAIGLRTFDTSYFPGSGTDERISTNTRSR